jgi:chemotaxis protein MotB
LTRKLQRTTLTLGLALTTLSSGACVSQSTYDDLQNTMNALQQEHDALKAQHDALSKLNADAQKALGASGEELGKARKDIGDLQEALEMLQRQKEQSEARVAEFKELLARFQSMIDAGQLNVKLVRGRLIVELASDVLFAPGSSRLSDDGQATIRQATELLIGLSDRTFQIEGHTDNDPISTKVFPSNWELASARALSVVRTMVDNGMEPSRLSAASFAEFMPVAENDGPQNKQLNRRIEIVLVPDLTQLPGFEEMQQLIDKNREKGRAEPPNDTSDNLPTPPPLPPNL